MKFINRSEPLAFLNRQYTERHAQFIVVYGKRRVGKTELVKQFFADKPHIYFLADKTSAHDQLKTLSTKVGEFYGDAFVAERGFGSWEQVFAFPRVDKRLICSEFGIGISQVTLDAHNNRSDLPRGSIVREVRLWWKTKTACPGLQHYSTLLVTKPNITPTHPSRTRSFPC